MLVPATMLILIVLGGIAVDLTAVHGAQRSTYRIASAAADDAAGMIDHRLLQETGQVRIDEPAARRVIAAQLGSADLPGQVDGVTVAVGPNTVDLRFSVRVTHVFLSAVPGVDDAQDVPIAVRGRLQP